LYQFLQSCFGELKNLPCILPGVTLNVSLVVITGANNGIGLALTRHYRERDEDVVACVLENSSELKATGAEVHNQVDLRDKRSIDKFCNKMAKRSVDNLIHAAGIFTDRGLVDELDFDAMHEEIEVNVIGPLRLTKGLLPNMKEGAKIAFISSAMGSIEENELGTSYGYRVSKASQNMIVKTLSNDLWSRMIAAVSIHPGYVKTEFTGFSGH
jgi:NAD(P)-dependent dehydrogenase (short-subunit alcohol dehydrogenase family)